MKSWILHHSHPIVIGLISVLISLAYLALWESSKHISIIVRSSKRALIDLLKIKLLSKKWLSRIIGYCFFSFTIKWYFDAQVKISTFLIPSSFSSYERREGDKSRKKRGWSGGLCYPAPDSLLILVVFLFSQHGGINWSVFFCSDWRLPSVCSVFKLVGIFSADWNDFFFFSFVSSVPFLSDMILWVCTASELTGDEC